MDPLQKSRYEGQSDQDYSFEIKHFFTEEKNEEEKIESGDSAAPWKPFLGRMDFSKNFKAVPNFAEYMKKMKTVGFEKAMLPLFFMTPLPAMAASRGGSPAGFEEFTNIYGTGFPQNFIDISK